MTASTGNTVKLGKCECSDDGCKCCAGSCERPGEQTLYRVDMEDATGTVMCEGCADDAMESGLFTNHDNRHCECGELYYQDCHGNNRCEVCDEPCPHCYDGGM